MFRISGPVFFQIKKFATLKKIFRILKFWFKFQSFMQKMGNLYFLEGGLSLSTEFFLLECFRFRVYRSSKPNHISGKIVKHISHEKAGIFLWRHRTLISWCKVSFPPVCCLVETRKHRSTLQRRVDPYTNPNKAEVRSGAEFVMFVCSFPPRHSFFYKNNFIRTSRLKIAKN